MNVTDETATRIVDLEEQVKTLTESLTGMRAERDNAQDLIAKMRDLVEDDSALRDQWIDAFDMTMNDKGLWQVPVAEAWDMAEKVLERNKELVTKWNRFVSKYNALVKPQPVGRPLAASEAQVADVHRRHKVGESRRKVAMATGLSVSTVRTIVEKKAGTDRTSKAMGKLRRMEFDRLRAAECRRRKRIQDGLPKQIADVTERAVELVKAAKGIGKD